MPTTTADTTHAPTLGDAIARFDLDPRFYHRVRAVSDLTGLSSRDVLAVLHYSDALDAPSCPNCLHLTALLRQALEFSVPRAVPL